MTVDAPLQWSTALLQGCPAAFKKRGDGSACVDDPNHQALKGTNTAAMVCLDNVTLNFVKMRYNVCNVIQYCIMILSMIS